MLYTKPQMTPAPTKEIAIGMKMRDFASGSYFTRSASRAISTPSTTVPETMSRIHLMLLPYDDTQNVFQAVRSELRFSSPVRA